MIFFEDVEFLGTILEWVDVPLIHLRNDLLHRGTIPQKTQTYLAAGRAIIMAVKGDVANLIEEANAGVLWVPENPASITEAMPRNYAVCLRRKKKWGGTA